MNAIKHYCAASASQAWPALTSLLNKHARLNDAQGVASLSILLPRFVAAVVANGCTVSSVIRVNEEVPVVLRAGAICSARELAYATGGVHAVVCERDVDAQDVSVLHALLPFIPCQTLLL
jgi:hypothetical protein